MKDQGLKDVGKGLRVRDSGCARICKSCVDPDQGGVVEQRGTALLRDPELVRRQIHGTSQRVLVHFTPAVWRYGGVTVFDNSVLAVAAVSAPEVTKKVATVILCQFDDLPSEGKRCPLRHLQGVACQ
jgi:hypothetical protein